MGGVVLLEDSQRGPAEGHKVALFGKVRRSGGRIEGGDRIRQRSECSYGRARADRDIAFRTVCK